MKEKQKKEYSNTPKMENTQINEMDQTNTFMIVNVEDKWRIGVAGRWLSRNEFATKEEAQQYINQKPWDLIGNYAATLAEFVVKEMFNQNKVQQ